MRRNEDDPQRPRASLRQRQLQHLKRLKARALVAAREAAQHALCERRVRARGEREGERGGGGPAHPELAREQLGDDRALAAPVIGPPLSGHNVVRPPVRVGLLRVRLGADPVQVLGKAGQHMLEELLRILLVEAVKLGLELAEKALELPRRHRHASPTPHVADEGGVGYREAALHPHARLVDRVDVVHKVPGEEVLCQGPCVGQTLQRRVHVARVAQVGQAHAPGHAPVRRDRALLRPLHVLRRRGLRPRPVRLLRGHQQEVPVVDVQLLQRLLTAREVLQGGVEGDEEEDVSGVGVDALQSQRRCRGPWTRAREHGPGRKRRGGGSTRRARRPSTALC